MLKPEKYNEKKEKSLKHCISKKQENCYYHEKVV